MSKKDNVPKNKMENNKRRIKQNYTKYGVGVPQIFRQVLAPIACKYKF